MVGVQGFECLGTRLLHRIFDGPKSSITNQTADTWEDKNVGAGPANNRPKFLLLKPSYECVYQAVILGETLYYHTPSKGNEDAAICSR